MRYLSLDVGRKNIGVAVGELIASEVTTIRTKGETDFYDEKNSLEAFAKIKSIMEREQVDALVIGLPVDEHEQMTEEANKIKKFAEGLQEKVNIKIHYVNETLTSFMAKDILEGQGLSPEEIDERVDQLSASLILQQFIEENALV
jgi:putative holliday junction resolvase